MIVPRPGRKRLRSCAIALAASLSIGIVGARADEAAK
jgi:hypothetical protein